MYINSNLQLAVITFPDFPLGGSIGLATDTVDICSSFSIQQNTAGQIITLPIPSDVAVTTITTVENSGTVNFTIHGILLAPGKNTTIHNTSSTWDAPTAVGSPDNSKIDVSEKGAASGVATLNGSGKIPNAQLPSYVDDVLEFVNLAGFPLVGDTGVIYVDQATNLTYRWSGTAYIQVGGGATNNIYTNNGTLLGNRVVTQGALDLTFGSTGTAGLYIHPGTTAKVGIGTNVVGANLTVSGTPGTNIVDITDGTNTMSFDSGSSTTDLRIVSTSQLELQTAANLYQMVLDTNGNTGLGTDAPVGKLSVELGTGGVNYNGSAAGLAGVFHYNRGGTQDPTRLVISNNGTVTGGGGSLEFWANAFGGNVGHGSTVKSLSTQGNAAGESNGTLIFETADSSTTPSEKVRITKEGNLGIANNAPTEKLDVTGNVRFSGALLPNNAAGTSGQVLTSAGAGNVPTWVTPTTVPTNTDGVPEGVTNLYHTPARVRATLLTGLVLTDATDVVATDTIVVGIGKIQRQLDDFAATTFTGADNTQTEAGVSTVLGVTPAGASATYIKKSFVNAKGDIISASADDTPSIISIGTNGQVLTADSAQPSGLKWTTPSGIADTDGLAEGATNLYHTPARVRSTVLTGLVLTDATDITAADTLVVALGKIQRQIDDIPGATAAANDAGTEAGASTTTYVTPASGTATYIKKSAVNAKGDLVTATANDTPAILAVGTNNQVLIADSTQASGLRWAAQTAAANLGTLTAATAVNTIDSTNFAQTWNWSTATTQTPLTLTGAALTSGSVLSLTSVSTARVTDSALNTITSSGVNASAAVNAIGQTISVTNTGLLSTNTGLKITSSGGTDNKPLVLVADALSNQQQLTIQGATNNNQQLTVGYNTVSNYGFFQPIIQGTGFQNTVLNPSGGNVGIANIAPTQALDVTGNARFSGALMPNNLAGTSGQVLTSAGAGVAPTWATAAVTGWGLLGNATTVQATNFIGTTDLIGFSTRTNNLIRTTHTSTGEFSVGTINAKVAASTYASAKVNIEYSANIVEGATAVDGLAIYNALNGVNVTTRMTLWNTNVTNGFLQYNNATYTGVGGANNLVLGTSATSNSAVAIATNNIERIRVLSTGFVGIGLIVPQATLHVTGGVTYTTNDFATGGVTGLLGNASTIDAFSVWTVNQTTAGQACTLSTPNNTTAGRQLIIVNRGTVSFTIHGESIPPGKSNLLVWSGAQWNPTSSVVTTQEITTVAVTTYTLLASDAGKILNFTSATAVTLTLGGLAVGQSVKLAQMAAGQVTIVTGGGLVPRHVNNLVKTSGLYAVVEITMLTATDALLSGSLSA